MCACDTEHGARKFCIFFFSRQRASSVWWLDATLDFSHFNDTVLRSLKNSLHLILSSEADGCCCSHDVLDFIVIYFFFQPFQHQLATARILKFNQHARKEWAERNRERVSVCERTSKWSMKKEFNVAVVDYIVVSKWIKCIRSVELSSGKKNKLLQRS